MKTYFIETLGCKVNHYESEAVDELLQDEGFERVMDKFDADIVIINTCTVTNLSDRKSRQMIRRSKRENPVAMTIVMGCYTQTSPHEVLELDEVDLIIGTSGRENIVQQIRAFENNPQKSNTVVDLNEKYEFEELPVHSLEDRTRAYMKVQEGCNRFCSYCIIPYARGRIHSRSIENSVREAKRLAENGFKEIILTGIHIGSYGKDLDEDVGLIDLIESIAEVEEIERIRLSSIEPMTIDEEFLKRGLATGKLCDHFHLSLQSGCDRTLKEMNRRYTTEEYRKTVELIRKYMPYAGITTDIIVGFPGETEEDFNETMDFVREIGFSRIHVFSYSPREGTPAAKRTDQIHGDIKRDRSHKLTNLGHELEKDFIEKNRGRALEVLFEERVDNANEGYTTNYIRTRATSAEYLENQIKCVKIVGIKHTF